MMFKKSWKGGERGRWRPSSPQFSHVYFFSCSRLFNFADLTITKPNRRKKYIRFETNTDTSGRGFYFKWGTKRRIKMTEVQLEKNDYVTGGLTRVEITFYGEKNQDLRSNRTWSLETAKRPSEKKKNRKCFRYTHTHTITRPNVINDTYRSALTEVSSNMWRSSWEELKKKIKKI